MQIEIMLTRDDLKQIIADYISNRVGYDIEADKVTIETKSKQNFKSEWEQADFRAKFFDVRT